MFIFSLINFLPVACVSFSCFVFVIRQKGFYLNKMLTIKYFDLENKISRFFDMLLLITYFRIN
jgi:hypothetical protein